MLVSTFSARPLRPTCILISTGWSEKTQIQYKPFYIMSPREVCYLIPLGLRTQEIYKWDVLELRFGCISRTSK